MSDTNYRDWQDRKFPKKHEAPKQPGDPLTNIALVVLLAIVLALLVYVLPHDPLDGYQYEPSVVQQLEWEQQWEAVKYDGK